MDMKLQALKFKMRHYGIKFSEHSNSIIIDEDFNSMHVNGDTYEDLHTAVYKLLTNKDCKYCSNCEYCVSCYGCINCVSCSLCRSCSDYVGINNAERAVNQVKTKDESFILDALGQRLYVNDVCLHTKIKKGAVVNNIAIVKRFTPKKAVLTKTKCAVTGFRLIKVTPEQIHGLPHNLYEQLVSHYNTYNKFIEKIDPFIKKTT